jgi:ribosomal protein S18 acetylase RimI-like enzyme
MDESAERGRQVRRGPGRDRVVTNLLMRDRAAWTELYQGCGALYEVTMPAEKLDLVWSWLHDDAHQVHGIVVRPSRPAGYDSPVGLAHYRPFPRPLHGSTGCYLDDLFVAPGARGTGAVDALLEELRARAALHGWDVVRWITRESNTRARSAYDRLAQRTPLLTYDMPPLTD